MGLAIGIGFEYDEDDPEGAAWGRGQLELIQQLLSRHGLPPYQEGTHDPQGESRAEIMSFGYSLLHYLRRVAARRRLEPEWIATPVREGEDPASDPAVERAGADLDFHLLVHSDCEGYYVPVDFRRVIFDEDPPKRLGQRLLGLFRSGPERVRLAGGMLGSSVQLMRELVEVAPALAIRLEDDGALTDAEAQRVAEIASNDAHPLYREHEVFLALFEASRLSVAHQKVIVFC